MQGLKAEDPGSSPLQTSKAPGHDTYTVVREPREVQRLEAQHELYISSFGYLLHPSIRVPDDARVADIGTGTGIFLADLAAQLPDTAGLHGFDISSSQFRPASMLPGNVKLHIGDAKLEFPGHLHGTMDVVVVRLLVAALTGEEWRLVTDNLVKLLKPGGWLQWQESDGIQGMTILRDEIGTRKSHIQASLNEIFASKEVRDKFKYPARNLARIFKEAGLQETDQDVVSTDRQPHQRSVTMRLGIEGLVSGIKAGMSGKYYSDEIGRLVEGWRSDVESGAYQRYNLHCFIGRKCCA